MTAEPNVEPSSNRRPTPSGEGERRAQRGYVPQYRMAAAFIYEALAAGRLRWIGVAHRGAGSFDDIVLGLDGRIVGHQVKTSRAPEAFRLDTLLLGAEAVWAAALVSLKALRALEPASRPVLVYACDDYPSLTDQLGDAPGATSAALLDLHRRHAADWTWKDWTRTAFARFLGDLRAAAGLDEAGFLEAWSAITFLTGGEGRLSLNAERTAQDDARIDRLAALLPQLVADRSDRDLWDVEEVRNRIGWANAFKPRHSHQFPAAAFYEENDAARALIVDALAKVSRGYIALVGPPGSGKSTLLAAGVLDAERMRTVRYLAFVPGEGQTLGRAEAFDFLHDLITALKKQGLGVTITPGQTVMELREQFQALLTEAGGRFQRDGIRTLVIVDGLDHIPREERFELSLLTALPPPDALPEGVVFLLGTQRLDLSDMPPAVQRNAEGDGRRLDIPALSRETVSRIATAAGLPDDVDRIELHERAAGHPLSTRYLVEGLLLQPDKDQRRAWLEAAPAYAGDIDRFYASAWSGLKGQTEAQKALGYIALAEGPLRQTALDSLVGRDGLDATWEAAHHLLMVGPAGELSVFHNSFRLFLQDRTVERLGRADERLKSERYRDLAAMSRGAEEDDAQRWMELRYLARAGEDVAVLDLATPERFREQFIQGRDPQDIQDDIGLAFAAVGRLRRSDTLLPLLLSRHEIALRSEAIGPDIVDAFLALGDRDAARNLLKADGPTLGDDVRYRVIDADLQAGDTAAAKEAFDACEPLDQLLGAEPVSDLPWDDELAEWARRVLAFRPVPQVLRALDRLIAPSGSFRSVDLDELRWRLKLTALEGELRRLPEQDPEPLRLALGLPDTDQGVVQLYGAVASNAQGRAKEAVGRIEAALVLLEDLEDHERLRLAVLGRRLLRTDLAERALQGLPAPTLRPSDLRDPDDLNAQVDAVLDHAETRAALGWPEQRGPAHDKPFLAKLQHRLEDLGRILGQVGRGEADAPYALSRLRQMLVFLARQEGEDPHDHDRHRLDRAMDRIVARIVSGAAALGDEPFRAILEDLDNAPDADWRLRQPDVRRAYALAAFRCDHDLATARARVAYVGGGERTPEAQLAEAAYSARALAVLGLVDEARSLLRAMHEEGLGLSRPAKKDPQYYAWIELLQEACVADPASREARVAFMVRFVSGLSDNEGYDIGGRVLPAVLTEGAQTRADFALAVADRAERLGDLNWSRMVGAIGRGAVRAEPELGLAAATIVGRLALPFTSDHDEDPLGGLISKAPEPSLEAVTLRVLDIVETETADEVRLKFLESAIDAARDRGLRIGADRLERWRGELPLPSSGPSPENPFFHTRSLSQIEGLLAAPDTTHIWNAARAFVRTAPLEGFTTAKGVLERWPELLEHRHVLRTMADLAIKAGQVGEAAAFAGSLAALADSAQYDDGWAGGARLLAAEVDADLRGAVARAAAFDALCSDLAKGRAWPARLLQYIVDVLKVISPTPAWPDAWTALEAHLSGFREYIQGDVLTAPASVPAPRDGVIVLADLLHRALQLGPIILADRVRLAMLEIADDEAGRPVVACLIDRLLDGPDDQPLLGVQFAWVHRDLDEVRAILMPRLPRLLRHGDIGVRRAAEALRDKWGVTSPSPPDVGQGASLTSSGSSIPEAFTAKTWPIARHLRATAQASSQDLDRLTRRAGTLLAGLHRPPTEGVEAETGARAQRLEVYAPQVRWTARAAFLAQRMLLAELADAGAIPPRHAERISDESGVDGRIDFHRRIEPRPSSLPRPAFGDLYRDEHHQTWLDQIDEDLATPTILGWVVLGGWSRHRSIKRSGEHCAEQVYGIAGPADSFDDLIASLPRMHLGVQIELGAGPKSLIRRLTGPAFWDHDAALAPCPLVAEQLGWRPEPRDPTQFVDQTGRVQARTLSWRDSGCTGRIHGDAVLREGQLVVARQGTAPTIDSLSALDISRRAWRTVARDGSLARVSAQAG